MNYLANKFDSEAGKAGMATIGGIIAGILGLVLAGKVLVAMWPQIDQVGTDVGNLTGTDAGTVTLQAVWPIIPIAIAVAVVAGLIMKYMPRGKGI